MKVKRSRHPSLPSPPGRMPTPSLKAILDFPRERVSLADGERAGWVSLIGVGFDNNTLFHLQHLLGTRPTT